MEHRKHPRLPNYDYTAPGGYFVTICTREKKPIFGDICVLVGRGPCAPPNAARLIAEGWIGRIQGKFPNWTVDNSVVMPNHVHLLLQAHSSNVAGHMGPALQDVIAWYKTMTANAFIRAVKADSMPRFEKAVWQSSFYESVIRGQEHYLRAWQYIDENPVRWAEDEYYIPLRLTPPDRG